MNSRLRVGLAWEDASRCALCEGPMNLRRHGDSLLPGGVQQDHKHCCPKLEDCSLVLSERLGMRAVAPVVWRHTHLQRLADPASSQEPAGWQLRSACFQTGSPADLADQVWPGLILSVPGTHPWRTTSVQVTHIAWTPVHGACGLIASCTYLMH